jgi:hypothetical protein
MPIAHPVRDIACIDIQSLPAERRKKDFLAGYVGKNDCDSGAKASDGRTPSTWYRGSAGISCSPHVPGTCRRIASTYIGFYARVTLSSGGNAEDYQWREAALHRPAGEI